MGPMDKVAATGTLLLVIGTVGSFLTVVLFVVIVLAARVFL